MMLLCPLRSSVVSVLTLDGPRLGLVPTVLHPGFHLLHSSHLSFEGAFYSN
jgi:hypothetical protein